VSEPLARAPAAWSGGWERSAGARLGGGRWRLGGKTGTGPATASPHDGWFAGLIFDGTEPRYAIAVYIDRHGPGGGVAAGIAADVALRIAARP
jgi:cell division protein FtsI/penicillin-binding protein 2